MNWLPIKQHKLCRGWIFQKSQFIKLNILQTIKIKFFKEKLKTKINLACIKQVVIIVKINWTNKKSLKIGFNKNFANEHFLKKINLMKPISPGKLLNDWETFFINKISEPNVHE